MIHRNIGEGLRVADQPERDREENIKGRTRVVDQVVVPVVTITKDHAIVSRKSDNSLFFSDSCSDPFASLTLS